MKRMYRAGWMKSRVGGVLGLLTCVLLSLSADGQQSILVTSTVHIPGEAAAYAIDFEYSYQVDGAIRMADGTVEIPGIPPARARLVIGKFRARGPDSLKAARIGARITLPNELSGTTIWLGNRMRKGSSDPFVIAAPGRFSAVADVSIIYGMEGLQPGTLDFSQTFTFRPVDTAAAAAETDSAVALQEAVTETDTVGSINVSVPAEKPAYLRDFDELSPQEFIRTWPEQERLVNLSLARIPWKLQVSETSTNVYEVTFEYVRSLLLDSVSGGSNYEIRENKPLPLYGHRLTVAVADTGVYRLHLSDSTKNDPLVTVELDNLIAGDFLVSGDSVIFNFEGGHPPYSLLFYRNGAPYTDYNLGVVSSWTVTQDSLRKIVGSTGEFGLQLLDEQRTMSWNFGGKTLRIPRPEPGFLVRYGPIAGGAILILLIVVLVFRGTRRRKRKKIIRANLSTEAAPSRPRPAIVSSRYPDSEARPYTGEYLGNKFRITPRPRATLLGEHFNPDERPDHFLVMVLDEHWSQSSISAIFFEHRAIADLDAFLRKENTSKIGRTASGTSDLDWETNKPIPEIGGMLMGQYRLNSEGGGFRVSVEKFVPLRARVQNVVKVEIDPMSLARDLSLAQDEHTELTVVGWFHTHPGHGLFLSQPDLKVQYGHFRNGYNFAMEIDSMTDRLDTAFFTYRQDGTMNNANTKRPETEWFSWAEIASFSRRNTLI